jgi:ADP-L-glycero-D-manno-heptose 6-epimerase
MLIITGAVGFIGSCLLKHLNTAGYKDIVLVDAFDRPDKIRNLEGKSWALQLDRDDFLPWLDQNAGTVDAVFHIGARTDTTETRTDVFDKLNLHYSQQVWSLCTKHQIPLLYASSAATYGLGALGYRDDPDQIPALKPLNPYGQSKQDFDVWALRQLRTPPFWAGFKFFNVYGPNEYHKGRMASVIFHTVRQIKATGGMKLFRSHRPGVRDGAQQRDFIYVKDVVQVLLHVYQNRPPNGIYNLGTGQARTFIDLASATFRALNLEPNITYVDTPLDIRDTYQYFTQADMSRLRHTGGYSAPFYTLEAGIEDYVQHYLKDERIW